MGVVNGDGKVSIHNSVYIYLRYGGPCMLHDEI